MIITPDENFITKNYEETLKTVTPIKPLHRMVDDLGNRYALCPASTRKEYYSAFPGGLCYHNRHMLFWMKKFAGMMTTVDYANSLIKVATLHEIGKIGNLEQDYYLDKDSDWHRERGIYFEVNPDIQYMKVPDRSLWLAQHYDIKLSEEEYLSILLHDLVDEEGYHYKTSKLVSITQFAYRYSTQLEKSNEVLWPSIS